LFQTSVVLFRRDLLLQNKTKTKPPRFWITEVINTVVLAV
jgi:hypothetical protein